MPGTIRIGTRGSDLALAQARETGEALLRVFPDLAVEIVIIRSTGDRRTDIPLREVAKQEGFLDKGIFTKELESALLEESIDVAVHSMKDLPTALDPRFKLVSALPRESSLDVLVTQQKHTLASLPQGVVLASSSVRRQKMLHHLRPDLQLCDIRGNVPTRLEILRCSEVIDGTLLAEAGLKRLNIAMDDHSHDAGLFFHRLNPKEFLPAASQGIVGFEILGKNQAAAAIMAAINDESSFLKMAAERTFLHALDAGCDTPVGVHTEIFQNEVVMSAIVFSESRDDEEPRTARVAADVLSPELGDHLYQNLS